MRIDGHLAVVMSSWLGNLRRGHRKLTRRPGRYWLLSRGEAALIDWVPHEGLWAWRLHRNGPSGELLKETSRPEKLMPPKKRQALGLEGVPIPALPLESACLKKYPRVLEHLICTAYDDGSLRNPGSIRIDNKLILLVVTLYDPDSGMRLPCNGVTVDECLALADKLLGAPDCPWEVDRWLTSELQKKEKNKARNSKRKK